MSKTSKIVLWVLLGVVLIMILSVVLSSMLMGPKEINFTELDDKIIAKEVDEIQVDNYVYYGLKQGKVIYKAIGPRGEDNAMTETFWAAVQSNGVSVSYTDPNAGSFMSYLVPLFGVVLVCVVFWLIIRQTQGGGSKAMSFAKTKARVNSNIKVRFSDVAGAEEEKAELAEVVEFLKSPKKFSDLGARIPKGILLVGPPGTGKTLFAKAVAGEANVPFFSISGSDFVEMFVGVGASRVRDLFDAAKKSQPCIVFIDEIDAVGRQRGTGLGGGHDEREQTLNQLLVQMDGFETNEGIIVMAATNRADILDPALLRPGRFDRQIHVNLPDVRGREQILKVHARNKPLAPDVNFKVLARMTSGFSGADLENLLNEAALLAARRNLKAITMTEIEEATIKVVVGTEKKSHVMTERERKLTAYHEGGHAVVTYFCKTQDPVHQISIIPRGMAGGYTMQLPAEDRSYRTRTEMQESLIVLLGGRVAESLTLDDISTGASNDIERATKTARAMVTKYGMSDKLGSIAYGRDDSEPFLGRDMGHIRDYSEATASAIDAEIKHIVNTAYERTENILKEHMDKLQQVAQFLYHNEKMSGEEFRAVMEGNLEALGDKNPEKLAEAAQSAPEEQANSPEQPVQSPSEE